jgi:threonine dehydratase
MRHNVSKGWVAGSALDFGEDGAIADGVAGRCPIPEVLEDLLTVLDDVVLVDDEGIKAGMGLLYQHAGLVVEPSAALGVAAVLANPERYAGRRVAAVICGSNVVPSDFARRALT